MKTRSQKREETQARQPRRFARRAVVESDSPIADRANPLHVSFVRAPGLPALRQSLQLGDHLLCQEFEGLDVIVGGKVDDQILGAGFHQRPVVVDNVPWGPVALAVAALVDGWKSVDLLLQSGSRLRNDDWIQQVAADNRVVGTTSSLAVAAEQIELAADLLGRGGLARTRIDVAHVGVLGDPAERHVLSAAPDQHRNAWALDWAIPEGRANRLHGYWIKGDWLA